MDEDPSDEPAFETVETSRWFILGRDDEGYGIWPVGDDQEGPLQRYPWTDEGLDLGRSAFRQLSSAARLGRLPVRLRNLVVVAVVAWVVVGFVQFFEYVREVMGSRVPGSGLISIGFGWATVIGLLGDPIGRIAIGGTLVLVAWLAERRLRDAT